MPGGDPCHYETFKSTINVGGTFSLYIHPGNAREAALLLGEMQ